MSVTEISSYRNQEITILIDHYSKEKASTYKSITINWAGDIDGVAAIEQWLGFSKYMFLNKAEEEKFQMKLMNCKNEKETLFVLQKPLDDHKLYSTCLYDKACAIIFPNSLKLLLLMLRFFSKMKLVKTDFEISHCR